MGNNENDSRPNLLEKQVKDITEWQKNANNPGYYVSSGKVPVTVRKLFRRPIIMLIIGIVLAMSVKYSLSEGFSIDTLLGNVVIALISAGLIIGGIKRIVKNIVS